MRGGWGPAALVGLLVACGSGAGQPGRVVEGFYAAAARGDAVGAEAYLAAKHRGNGGEIVRTATR